MRTLNGYVALSVLLIALGAGCSTQTRTVTTETRDDASGRLLEQTSETITETRSESGGVLSTTVDFVGDVLSLPFRAVGGLLQGIF
jgi:hypothetical protein